FVATDALWGTIGGGQLEYLAIEAARSMLSGAVLHKDMDVPLGPEIGQCCGGRVELKLARMRASDKRAAQCRADKNENALPHVYVMGAGHVGRALANQFQHMPVRCVLVDTRGDELALCEAAVEMRETPLPEIDLWNAPSGSAFIVLTHDHGLDFLLTSAALERGDAAYVGMIGSATKRVKFRNWARTHCDGQTIQDLNCPIGAHGSCDKRPSVIAAFVVAEVMAELTSEPVVTAQCRVNKAPMSGQQPDRKGKSA
ncbi:MAG: xanthine dehydrogenase accessory protein XdhC, partial [Pseudoruegeria sp.]